MNPHRSPLHSVLEQLALDFARSLVEAVVDSSPSEAGAVVGARGARVSAAVEPASVGGKLVAKLTEREREIFEGAVRGASNETLSRNLAISVKTVQTHRAKINLKLGVHSPAELISFAVMHGILTPGLAAAPAPGSGLPPTFNLAEVERRTIEGALQATSQNRARAAALLGIPASLLAWKLRPTTGDEPPAGAPGSAVRRARKSAGGAGAGRRGKVARATVASPPEEEDPAGAITDPWGILGGATAPEASEPPPPTRRSEPEPAPRRDRRPAVRPGEDILVGSGGGLVLRRRRSSSAIG